MRETGYVVVQRFPFCQWMRLLIRHPFRIGRGRLFRNRGRRSSRSPRNQRDLSPIGYVCSTDSSSPVVASR